MKDEIYGLIEDVNPVEIQDQIGRNNLVEWCNAWKAAMRIALGQERMTGKWARLRNGNVECSRCDMQQKHELNFCPYCGAKMEVVE